MALSILAPVSANALQAVVSTPGNSSSKDKNPPGIFGALELRTNAARGAERWPDVMDRAGRERNRWLACERGKSACPPKLKAWRDGLARARGLTRWRQIVEVNRLVNELVRFRKDVDQYGRADHWATPGEALLKSGDCEDYAILKYLSLRELGFADRDMRMVVVKITRRNIGHAVLAVNNAGARYILDNLKQRPIEHSAVRGYRPIYSVNSRGQWLALKVKTRTARVASLKPLVPSRESAGKKPTDKPIGPETNGLKLPDIASLALDWDKSAARWLPAAGWGQLQSQESLGYGPAVLPVANSLPQI